jgi:hypothetical protein
VPVRLPQLLHDGGGELRDVRENDGEITRLRRGDGVGDRVALVVNADWKKDIRPALTSTAAMPVA